MTKRTPIPIRVRNLPHSFHYARFPRSYPEVQRPTMEVESQRPKGREGVISELNEAIAALDLANNISNIAPAKVVFSSVSTLLRLIRVCFPFSYDGLLQVYAYLGLNG